MVDECLPRVDSSVPLMHHDSINLRSLSLIQIMPKECTPKLLSLALVFYESIVSETQPKKTRGLGLNVRIHKSCSKNVLLSNQMTEFQQNVKPTER